MKPIYWGIFTMNMNGTLYKVVPFQHVTFGFKTEYPEEVRGKIADIKVVGYGNNGLNEAYLVELPEWTKQYYRGSSKPHVTLSTSIGAKPVDSWKLDFKKVKPFMLEGMFGYFDEEGVHLY